MAKFTAELRAFDCYYDDMKQYLDHSRVEAMFISEGVVDGSVAQGGAAVFLPDSTVKMPQLLEHVRNNIGLDGPTIFNKLVSALRKIPTYCNLASDLESKCAELKQKHNGSTIPSSSTADHPGEVIEEQQPQESDEDDDGDAQVDGKKKKKKSKRSMYPTINRKNPPCAIIINNVSFKKPEPEIELEERSWSKNDVGKILTLEKEFGIRFNVHENLEAQQMKNVLSFAVGSHSTYSALLLFIMTHGSTGDMLYGSDGKLVSLKELAAIFEATNCPALKDKPKIFILHYCRGTAEEPAHREGRSEASGARIKHTIPQKADFLFVHSTTDGSVAYGHEKKGFIAKLVEIFIENLNENHLQDVLLIVNRELAKIEYLLKGQRYKQMPSVVTQMRDKVWFDKD